MPGGDRTGPAGAGPRTGRGAGYCSGAVVPGYANPVGRLGTGRGFGGGGRGWRHMFYATGLPRWARGVPGFAPMAPEDEAAALKNQADWLKSRLDAIQARLGQIKKD
jgi:hypothetical protein